MNLSLLTLAMTVGQPVHPAVPPPVLPPAPFLFVSVSAPGTPTVTWLPGTAESATATAPVGLRPGYPYRFQLDNVAGAKNLTLYPSIEIRGALVPRPGLADVSKYPIPITLTDRDIDRILDGRYVVKVYYLEDPETAVPAAAIPGEPLETTAETEEQAVRDARLRGRPMLILRVGERPFTKAELARENVPGTVLFPGAKTAPVPIMPPMLPFAGIMPYDPIIGPKGAGEECLKDGGDTGPRLGVREDGTLGGLDPSDTAMQFTTPRGTKVVPSNRVCICAPRFISIRVDRGPAGHHALRSPEGGVAVRPPIGVHVPTHPAETRNLDQIVMTTGSKRPSGLESKIGPLVHEQWSGKLAGVSGIQGVAVVAQVRGPDEITSFPGCHMLLQKRIEGPAAPKIGDEVTVYLKFSNPTTETMTGVIVSDSLTARLEYIDGTAKSSRAATFTAKNNEAGSVVLQWVVDGKLAPGESGIIMFKARIK